MLLHMPSVTEGEEENVPQSKPSGTQDAAALPSRYWYLCILALSGFVTSFGAHIVATNLPAYAEAVGVGAFMIGVLIAAYDFAELFAKPLAGFLADRHGMKLLLIIGLVIFILGSLLFLLLSPRLLLLVRFIQGVGAAALSTVSITLVARYFTVGRGKAFGLYNALKGAGYVMAPALGGFLTYRFGFSMIFVVAAGVGFLALLLSLFLPGARQAGGQLEEDEELSLQQLVLIFTEPRLLPLYAVIVINMFLVGILFGFLPVYLYAIGYTPVQSGSVVSVATLSYLLAQPLAGYLADTVEVRLTVLLGLLLAALGIIVTVFTSGMTLVVVVTVAGVGIGTVWTNSDTLVSTLVEKGRLGASMGAAQSFKEFGDMTGPLLIGFLTQVYGVRTGFVTCGTLALLCLVILARSHTFTRTGER